VSVVIQVVGVEKLAEANLEKPGKQIDLLSRALESAMAATDTPDKVETRIHDKWNLYLLFR
jgi:hypothetical protein